MQDDSRALDLIEAFYVAMHLDFPGMKGIDDSEWRYLMPLALKCLERDWIMHDDGFSYLNSQTRMPLNLLLLNVAAGAHLVHMIRPADLHDMVYELDGSGTLKARAHEKYASRLDLTADDIGQAGPQRRSVRRQAPTRGQTTEQTRALALARTRAVSFEERFGDGTQYPRDFKMLDAAVEYLQSQLEFDVYQADFNVIWLELLWTCDAMIGEHALTERRTVSVNKYVFSLSEYLRN